MNDLEFWLGHGTRNDFVLVVDADGTSDFDGGTVAALCDRRGGLGGDGWIRLVRTQAQSEWAHLLDEQPGAEWFMDYRNADGSVAEMCGNGIRVFAHLLESLDLADFGGEARPIGTRAGIRWVERTAESTYRVGMGKWHLPDVEQAVAGGSDARVDAIGLEHERPALSVDMGNPHTVVALASTAELIDVDLTRQPDVTPMPPHGTNVEFIVPGSVSESAPGQLRGHVQMRVFERGVGETQSCGTGACAAAVAARFWMGEEGPDTWDVQVPGGVVTVTIHPDAQVDLEGPAAIIAQGRVDLSQLGE